MKSSASVVSKDLASIFAPIGNNPIISTEITTFQLQDFTQFYEDGTSKKLWAIVSDRGSPSGRILVQLFSNIFDLQARNQSLRAIMAGSHVNPPDMKGILSLFIPDYSPKELSSGKLPTDSKMWKLVSIFSCSAAE